MTAPLLQTAALVAGYGSDPILHGVDLALVPGKITAIVGPNACGKSTLLRALTRLLAPQGGVVTLDGTALPRIPPKALARRLGFLPQTPLAPEGITVRDLVGRASTTGGAVGASNGGFRVVATRRTSECSERRGTTANHHPGVLSALPAHAQTPSTPHALPTPPVLAGLDALYPTLVGGVGRLLAGHYVLAGVLASLKETRAAANRYPSVPIVQETM